MGKFISKIIIIFSIFVLSFAILLKSSTNARKITSYYIIDKFINNENLKVVINDFNFSFNYLYLDKIKIRYYSDLFEIKNLKLYFSFTNFIDKGKINYRFIKTNFILDSNKRKFSLDLSGYVIPLKKTYYFSGTAKLNEPNLSKIFDKKKNIEINFTSKIKPDNLNIENISFIIDKNSYIKSYAKIGFYKNSKKIKSLDVNCDINNLPLKLYKIILPDGHPIKNFFEYSIIGGDIKSGSISAKIPPEIFNFYYQNNNKEVKLFFDKNVNGKFNIENFKYKYDDNLPEISNVKALVSLIGSDLKINLLHANIGDIDVRNANVSLNFFDENIIVKATAKTLSKVKDFQQFIEKDTLNSLKEKGINISNIESLANTNINIKVPLGDDISIFDISTSVDNFEANFFDDKLEFRNGKLSAKYDGSILNIKTHGKLNNNDSKIEISIKTDEENEKIDYDTKLLAEINIKGSEDKKLTEYISIPGGHSKILVDYLSKNEKSTIKITSNLTNLDFLINPLSIHKPKNNKAQLKIIGELSNSKNQVLSLNLVGENNLNISGKIFIDEKSTKISFDNFYTQNNNFISKIILDNDKSFIKLRGDILDLSDINLFEYFKNDSKNTPQRVEFNSFISKIKLKNKINIYNVLSDFDCYLGICKVGKLYSNIGNNNFLRIFKNDIIFDNKKYQRWTILSSDSGSLISALDITKKIKSGNLIFFADIQKESKNSEIVGYLKISDFYSTKNKVLVKLISIISIPGLLNVLNNNNNIYFDTLEVKFIYRDNIINLYEIKAKGQFFDVKCFGSIDLDKKIYSVKGVLTPSFWGLNRMLGSFPVLGAIFSGKSKAILNTPFSFSDGF